MILATRRGQPLQPLTTGYHVAVCAIDGGQIHGPTPSVIMRTGITAYNIVSCYSISKKKKKKKKKDGPSASELYALDSK